MKTFTNDSISCPVSVSRVDENTVRLIAFLVLAVMMTGLILKSPWPVFFLMIDFATRAFTDGKFSILKNIALTGSSLLGLKKKPVDAAPKKFAAGVGFIFSLSIFALLQVGFNTAALAVSGVLVFCAVLESVFCFCVGCIVYSAILSISGKSVN